MPRLSILNMAIGFLVLFLAACIGSFIAFDMTEGYLRDPEILSSWQLALQKSSHGHSNLFGILHILFGLTLPYSKLSLNLRKWQTLGLFSGTLAMGPGMLWRAQLGPSESVDLASILVGGGLSLALLTLASHFFGLIYKLLEKA